MSPFGLILGTESRRDSGVRACGAQWLRMPEIQSDKVYWMAELKPNEQTMLFLSISTKTKLEGK